jgi:hypothetical protein
LLNNGHGEPGANAAFTFGADCEKIDGVLHGFESNEERIRAGGALGPLGDN